MRDGTTTEAAALRSASIMVPYARASAHSSATAAPSHHHLTCSGAMGGIAQLHSSVRRAGTTGAWLMRVDSRGKRSQRSAAYDSGTCIVQTPCSDELRARRAGALLPHLLLVRCSGVDVVLSHRPQSTTIVANAPTVDLGPLGTCRARVRERYVYEREK